MLVRLIPKQQEGSLVKYLSPNLKFHSRCARDLQLSEPTERQLVLNVTTGTSMEIAPAFLAIINQRTTSHVKILITRKLKSIDV